MSLISALLGSGNGRGHAEESPVRQAVVADVVPAETESDGIRAHRLAGETDSLVAEVAVFISQARRASLNVAKADQQLGFARTNLAKARQKIQDREVKDACAWAQTALNQASLARDMVKELVDKRQTLATLCEGLGKKLSELGPQVASASVIGKSVRTRLAPANQPPREWRALRWLDQIAEMRLKEAVELFGTLGRQLGRGELDGIKWDAGRVKAWLEQAVGYLETLAALEDFLATSNDGLADKATTAHTLMDAAYAVFRNHVSSEAMGWADEASNAYAGAKDPNDTKTHTEVLDKSLAVLLAIERRLLETAARRFNNRQACKERDLTGWEAVEFGGKAYYDLALVDHANMLVDLFPRRLSPGEQSNLDTSWCSDGPCTCH